MMFHRQRVLVGCALGLLLLVVIGVGGWSMVQVPPSELLVPGAIDIQVEARGFGEQQITYRVPGPRYAWYATLASNMEASGWSIQVSSRSGLGNTPEIYWRISPLFFVYVSEQATVQGGPNIVGITVYRSIIVPGGWYLP